jgi:hypothetical protein
LSSRSFSRRRLLQGSAAVAGALAVPRLTGDAHAQLAPGERNALCIVFLTGGYSGIFGSANSFSGAFGGTPQFGVAAGNMKDLGNDLIVDAPSLGSLDEFSLTHMATVGVNHGITNHEAAQAAFWAGGGNAAAAITLAREMGGDGAIKCAILGGSAIQGPQMAQAGISYQRIIDFKATIAALGGGNDPTIPDRNIMARILGTTQAMSQPVLKASPNSLATVQDGYTTAIDVLKKPVQQFDYNEMALGYGLRPTDTAAINISSQLLGAELMIRAGANVVLVADTIGTSWDTHGDNNGAAAREQMMNHLLRPLKTFIARSRNLLGINVVTTIAGDFARSVPNSDHAPALAATVIGRDVKVGTTGRLSFNGSLPEGSPKLPGYWAYLAELMKVKSSSFGANPHPSLLVKPA